jgi:hypothetical protein
VAGESAFSLDLFNLLLGIVVHFLCECIEHIPHTVLLAMIHSIIRRDGTVQGAKRDKK